VTTLKAGGSNYLGWQKRLEEARLGELQASRELKRSIERERHLQAVNGAVCYKLSYCSE
jgi:hypothetical protein